MLQIIVTVCTIAVKAKLAIRKAITVAETCNSDVINFGSLMTKFA